MSTQFISYVFAIFLVLFSIIIARNTTLLRETNDPESLYSFSRFQLFLWTVTIAPIILLHWSAAGKLYINNQSLILMGVSLVSTVSSIMISGSPQKKISKEVKGEIESLKRNVDDKKVKIVRTKKSILHRKDLLLLDRDNEEVDSIPSEGLFRDILKDEEGQFSIGRFQNLLFTTIFIFVYIAFFFKNEMCMYLEFTEPENIYLLMGISSGGYLIGAGSGK